MAQRKPKRSASKKKTISEQLAEQNESFSRLDVGKEQALERISRRFSKLETRTYADLAKQCGIDPESIREKYEDQYREEQIKVRKEIEKQRARASRVMTRRKRTYDRSLEKYMRMGFKESMDKFHHNPTIRFKLAGDWDTDVHDTGGHDPREGISRVPGAHADAGLVFLDGGEAGTFVRELRPCVMADVGRDERHGHANASVGVTLRFEKPAPRRTTYVYQQYLAMDCRGWGAANASNAWFVTMTNTLESGGSARANVSMRVMQSVHRGREHEEIMVEVLSSHSLASYTSRGATFFPLFFPIPMADPPVWGPFEADAWIGSAHPFMLFNESSGGGPVRVELEFQLEADARNEGSASEIRCDESGYGIRIREIGLRGTEL